MKKKKKDNDEFLGSRDVAWILDLSPDDVIELAHRGKINASKQGRFWRFRAKDIMAYVKQQERQNTA